MMEVEAKWMRETSWFARFCVNRNSIQNLMLLLLIGIVVVGKGKPVYEYLRQLLSRSHYIYLFFIRFYALNQTTFYCCDDDYEYINA